MTKTVAVCATLSAINVKTPVGLIRGNGSIDAFTFPFKKYAASNGSDEMCGLSEAHGELLLD
jgi:hypothetical protein